MGYEVEYMILRGTGSGFPTLRVSTYFRRYQPVLSFRRSNKQASLFSLRISGEVHIVGTAISYSQSMQCFMCSTSMYFFNLKVYTHM